MFRRQIVSSYGSLFYASLDCFSLATASIDRWLS